MRTISVQGSENFSGPHSVNGGFPARATSKVDLTFNPKSAGSHSGTVTFTDKYGNEVKILLQGVATDPARLAVTPQVIEADTLSLGDDPKEFTFKISNEGKYPLEYVFPKFSSESVDGGSKLHKFGYNIGSTLEGFNEFAYEAAPELINPTDIASKFDDATYLTNAIPLGFSFPFYGKSLRQDLYHVVRRRAFRSQQRDSEKPAFRRIISTCRQQARYSPTDVNCRCRPIQR